MKRDSRWHTIDSRNLVPGDIIRLETGDAVPADVRLISSQNLIVNETTLTGESVPVPKHPDTLRDGTGKYLREPQPLLQRYFRGRG